MKLTNKQMAIWGFSILAIIIFIISLSMYIGDDGTSVSSTVKQGIGTCKSILSSVILSGGRYDCPSDAISCIVDIYLNCDELSGETKKVIARSQDSTYDYYPNWVALDREYYGGGVPGLEGWYSYGSRRSSGDIWLRYGKPEVFELPHGRYGYFIIQGGVRKLYVILDVFSGSDPSQWHFNAGLQYAINEYRNYKRRAFDTTADIDPTPKQDCIINEMCVGGRLYSCSRSGNYLTTEGIKSISLSYSKDKPTSELGKPTKRLILLPNQSVEWPDEFKFLTTIELEQQCEIGQMRCKGSKSYEECKALSGCGFWNLFGTTCPSVGELPGKCWLYNSSLATQKIRYTSSDLCGPDCSAITEEVCDPNVDLSKCITSTKVSKCEQYKDTICFNYVSYDCPFGCATDSSTGVGKCIQPLTIKIKPSKKGYTTEEQIVFDWEIASNIPQNIPWVINVKHVETGGVVWTKSGLTVPSSGTVTIEPKPIGTYSIEITYTIGATISEPVIEQLNVNPIFRTEFTILEQHVYKDREFTLSAKLITDSDAAISAAKYNITRAFVEATDKLITPVRVVDGQRGEKLFIFKSHYSGKGQIEAEISVFGTSFKGIKSIEVEIPQISIDRSRMDTELIEGGYANILDSEKTYTLEFKVLDELLQPISPDELVVNYAFTLRELGSESLNYNIKSPGVYNIPFKCYRNGFIEITARKEGYTPSKTQQWEILCGTEKFCGDMICSVEIGETPDNCPEDCGPKPFPWIYVIIGGAVLLVIIIVGVILYRRRMGY